MHTWSRDAGSPTPAGAQLAAIVHAAERWGVIEKGSLTFKKVKQPLRGFDLARRLPAGDLRARGLDDREALPECPYRDDILPLWEAIHDWVDGYLRVFYREDVDVRGDAEVQTWVRELAAPAARRIVCSRRLPPVDIGYEALDTVYTVAALRFNRLGRYPPGHFTDPQVLEHVQSFQARLEAIERTIVARNTGDPRGEGGPRPLPYPYLLPSRITASINS